MTAYYNEIDPYAADWLRELIKAGHIAPGVVDQRSIEDVVPTELAEFTQCHFFAGIGVWSYALRLAGIPDDYPVWTGSCPCQPFSAAGKGLGFADERHLWPAWFHLIDQCKPAVVLGEQVASKDVDPWIDLVQADLESLGYAVGCVPFPSAGVGAPHIRDRAYWMGYSERAGLERYGRHGDSGGRRAHAPRSVASAGVPDVVADSSHERCDGVDALLRQETRGWNARDLPEAAGRSPTNGYWRDADWLGCRDGKWRPVEPGTFPMADGAPSRVGRLRAYGNAINAQAARVFIESAFEAVDTYDLI